VEEVAQEAQVADVPKSEQRESAVVEAQKPVEEIALELLVIEQQEATPAAVSVKSSASSKSSSSSASSASISSQSSKKSSRLSFLKRDWLACCGTSNKEEAPVEKAPEVKAPEEQAADEDVAVEAEEEKQETEQEQSDEPKVRFLSAASR
jgi:hypothetical protein